MASIKASSWRVSLAGEDFYTRLAKERLSAMKSEPSAKPLAKDSDSSLEPSVPPRKRRAPKGTNFQNAKIRLAWMRSDPCAYCGEQSESWDHIEPRKRGGNNADDNFVRSCLSCNIEKTSRTLLMFLAVRAKKKRDGKWNKRTISSAMRRKWLGSESC